MENTKQNDIAIGMKQKSYIENTGKKKRFWLGTKDFIGNFFTYLFSGLTVLGVVAIFVFVFQRGWKNLTWDFFTGDNAPSSEVFLCKDDTNVTGNSFTYDADNSNDEFFSTRWGIALKDGTGNAGKKTVVVTYVDPDSPMRKELLDQSTREVINVKVGWSFTELTCIQDDGQMPSLGTNMSLPEGYKCYAEWYSKTLDTTTTFIGGKLSIGGDGFRGSFIATIYTILLSLAISLPFGVGGAVYLAMYAKQNKFTGLIRGAIDLLAGIPSIIFGLIGSLIFIPLFSSEGNGSILSGCFTLAIMVLPIIVKNTEEAIKVVPKSLTQASLGLGASKAQTIFKVVLPNSMSGILTGVILAMGRIIGESASLIFAVGATIADNIVLNKSATTLAVHIWSIMQGDTPNYDAACSISIVILFIVLILNILLSIVAKKLNKFDAKPNKTWFGQLFDKMKSSRNKKNKEVKANA